MYYKYLIPLFALVILLGAGCAPETKDTPLEEEQQNEENQKETEESIEANFDTNDYLDDALTDLELLE